MPRAFRKPESFTAERQTRDALESFLRRSGFIDVHEERKQIGNATVQTVNVTDERGVQANMAVRLCWRKRFGKSDEGYAAFQLLFKVKNGDPEGSIKAKLDREARRGKTHWLVVQRDEDGITNAMMIPVGEVLPIWVRQRQIYERLIHDGKLGSREGNPAINGASPALYTQDDRAPSAVDFLSVYPGIRILVPVPGKEYERDDTFDDLPMPDFASLGSDGSPRYQKVVSGVKRDPAVRREVVARAHGRCEHCGIHRPYPGFLDVHHILGIEKSDRVWNCAALCPNCHRDAHVSPERDEMNAALLKFAKRFSPSAVSR